MKKQFIVPLSLAVLGVALFVLAGSPASSASAVPSVDVNQAAALQAKGTFLLDVREPGEFAEVHAQGATLIPLGQLQSRLNEIAQYKDKPVEVICRTGHRSAQGAAILHDAGFKQVTNVAGGTNAWVGAGLPVIRN